MSLRKSESAQQNRYNRLQKIGAVMAGLGLMAVGACDSQNQTTPPSPTTEQSQTIDPNQSTTPTEQPAEKSLTDQILESAKWGSDDWRDWFASQDWDNLTADWQDWACNQSGLVVKVPLDFRVDTACSDNSIDSVSNDTVDFTANILAKKTYDQKRQELIDSEQLIFELDTPNSQDGIQRVLVSGYLDTVDGQGYFARALLEQVVDGQPVVKQIGALDVVDSYSGDPKDIVALVVGSYLAGLTNEVDRSN
jgi:hypothetical protein